ncbi:MAG TPA: type II toxin-antitoxin system HigB family toxin [Cyclobacteriaceae bacterium]|nr:type II toxin-antitoxin system HigB family toxin [Cyclobacteriaceae bacterium]
MKTRIICLETIDDYIAADPRQRAILSNWIVQLKHARWNAPSDISRMSYPASFLGNKSNRVVFNIGRNSFTVICMYVFVRRCVYLLICWVGTRKEYRELPDAARQHIILSKC